MTLKQWLMGTPADWIALSISCASLGITLTIVPGCPATVPPPVPQTRLAYDVESSLEAAHCAPDGGLAALEAIHARFDRPAWVDCAFDLKGDPKSCNVPCPLP